MRQVQRISPAFASPSPAPAIAPGVSPGAIPPRAPQHDDPHAPPDPTPAGPHNRSPDPHRSRRRSRTARRLAALALSAGALAALAHNALRRDILLSARRALAHAEDYELFSLYPYLSQPDFHNHTILGRTRVTDPSVRDRLNLALRTGVRESDGKVMACFNPRHGLRVTRAGVTTDFAICFECRQVRVYRDGKPLASFPTSPSPEAVFDEVLTGAGVYLAPKNP